VISGRWPVIRNAKTMATINIYDLGGKKVGTFDLADEIFGAVNEDLLWEAVKHYRAGQHRGTHATKARWQVSGSGKKLWKQKGTGRARIGSIRSPLWRHGATVHGPTPRSYDYAFPRKKLLGALRSALAAKFADGKLTVVNSFELKDAKTKAFRAALDVVHEMGFTDTLAGAARLRRRMVERVLTQCEADQDAASPLLILLRRFATESAREEARLFCEELAAEEAVAPMQYGLVAA